MLDFTLPIVPVRPSGRIRVALRFGFEYVQLASMPTPSVRFTPRRAPYSSAVSVSTWVRSALVDLAPEVAARDRRSPRSSRECSGRAPAGSRAPRRDRRARSAAGCVGFRSFELLMAAAAAVRVEIRDPILRVTGIRRSAATHFRSLLYASSRLEEAIDAHATPPLHRRRVSRSRSRFRSARRRSFSRRPRRPRPPPPGGAEDRWPRKFTRRRQRRSTLYTPQLDSWDGRTIE